LTEPERLWKRYLYNNPRFIIAVTRELIGRQFKEK
jgi:UDP-N-acetyl-D-mannosaminuronic acid transferase (WecB/TagA/CpsF family)